GFRPSPNRCCSGCARARAPARPRRTALPRHRAPAPAASPPAGGGPGAGGRRARTKAAAGRPLAPPPAPPPAEAGRGRPLPGPQAASVTLDEDALGARGIRLGCGVIFVLPEGACGLTETARIMRFLAGESARQCGPCLHGLATLADALEGAAYGFPPPAWGRWREAPAGGRAAASRAPRELA